MIHNYECIPYLRIDGYAAGRWTLANSAELVFFTNEFLLQDRVTVSSLSPFRHFGGDCDLSTTPMQHRLINYAFRSSRRNCGPVSFLASPCLRASGGKWHHCHIWVYVAASNRPIKQLLREQQPGYYVILLRLWFMNVNVKAWVQLIISITSGSIWFCCVIKMSTFFVYNEKFGPEKKQLIPAQSFIPISRESRWTITNGNPDAHDTKIVRLISKVWKEVKITFKALQMFLPSRDSFGEECESAGNKRSF